MIWQRKKKFNSDARAKRKRSFTPAGSNKYNNTEMFCVVCYVSQTSQDKLSFNVTEQSQESRSKQKQKQFFVVLWQMIRDCIYCIYTCIGTSTSITKHSQGKNIPSGLHYSQYPHHGIQLYSTCAIKQKASLTSEAGWRSLMIGFSLTDRCSW